MAVIKFNTKIAPEDIRTFILSELDNGTEDSHPRRDACVARGRRWEHLSALGGKLGKNAGMAQKSLDNN